MKNIKEKHDMSAFIPESLDQPWVNFKKAPSKLQSISLDLKSASNLQTDVDPEFANNLSLMLLNKSKKQGGYMKNNFFKLPYLLSGGVIILLFLTMSGLQIRSPLDFLLSKNINGDFSIPKLSVVEKGMYGNPDSHAMISDRYESEVMPIAPDMENFPQNNRYGFYKNKTASIMAKVSDVQSTTQEVLKYLDSIGGIVENSNIYKDKRRGYQANISALVPEDQLSAVMQYMHRLSKEVVNESINVNDVSGQVDSYQSRLDTLFTQQQNYQDLLKQSNDINQKINLQNKLDNILLQIKGLESRKDNLQFKTVMSNINISFQESKFMSGVLYDWGVMNAFSMGVNMLVKTIGVILVLTLWGVIFTPIWLPIILLRKRFGNRKK